jgi:hypothetical protein
VAGNAGERRWPAAQAPADSADSGPVGVRWLVEEEGGVEAELLASAAWRGEACRGGAGEVCGARVSARGRRGREVEGQREEKIGTRGTSREGGRRTSPGRGRRQAGGGRVGLGRQGTQVPAWQR